ncbi:hypothetical protein PARHAE_01117 [Paracoccus haematequi]|uniref:Uncharacterized protein n=1 Tax=Paracoccus haematequi TaxID=2491866 RepID=A0A3S4GM66_9RHOB|nr:hypothetical protein [Paracoccus haematequi]VDS07937.1 hypothetical protein PARHAE_01117 [Paracoccus haematequi]
MLTALTGRWLLPLGAVLAACLCIWWLIDSRADLSAENDALRARIEAQERMDHVEDDLRGRDNDGIRDWLHRRSQ